MSPRIDAHWSYRGLPAVRMENRRIALEVLPDLGAKIFRLIDKAGDRNVLWENIRIPPHRAPVFASMDDHWSGGWDEAFPGGTRPFDFILGTHPSIAVTPSHRFDAPATHAEVDEFGGEEKLGVRGDRYSWPLLTRRDGEVFDVRHVGSPNLRSFALHYLTGLHAGWAACTDTATRRGFGLVFDPELFRVVWLWLVYGGWRGYYHAAMEAWTSHPGTLAEAVRLGRHRTMDPGDVLETTLYGVVYDGVAGVSDLRSDGTVVAAPEAG